MSETTPLEKVIDTRGSTGVPWVSVTCYVSSCEFRLINSGGVSGSVLGVSLSLHFGFHDEVTVAGLWISSLSCRS